MENKQILKEYENMSFNMCSNCEDIEQLQYDYELIKKYFEGKITFDDLMFEVDGDCPPNSCYWCNDNCDKCDLESEIEDIMIRGGDCFECWRRCLEQEAIEKHKIDLYKPLEEFEKMCNSFDLQCTDCKCEPCSEECENTICSCLNNKHERCQYSSGENIIVNSLECFVRYLQDNYNIEIKEK